MADLTEKQKLFVKEYLIDLNATQAAIRAGYSESNAGKIGFQLLEKTRIQDAIQKSMNERSSRTEITADMVLQRWWMIANADPNELIYHRRVCCRHCFGIEHEFQWKDETEYTFAVNSEIAAAKKEERDPNIPSDAGGYGFDPTIRPHPKCSKCYGEGYGEIQASDTRDLSPQAKLLYAGVKQTQGGFEIKMRDQDKALENVARHLGMFNDNLNIKGELSLRKLEDFFK